MTDQVSAVTTHVLDTARGRPAAGVPVRLEQVSGPGATETAATEIAARAMSSLAAIKASNATLRANSSSMATRARC